MNLKELDKARKIMERIKSLDTEIIELDRFAIDLVENGGKASLSLSIEIPKKSKEDKILDEDGSLVKGSETPGFYFLINTSMFTCQHGANESKNNSRDIKKTLSESDTLSVLAILLSEKQNERRGLLQQLKQFGIKTA